MQVRRELLFTSKCDPSAAILVKDVFIPPITSPRPGTGEETRGKKMKNSRRKLRKYGASAGIGALLRGSAAPPAIANTQEAAKKIPLLRLNVRDSAFYRQTAGKRHWEFLLRHKKGGSINGSVVWGFSRAHLKKRVLVHSFYGIPGRVSLANRFGDIVVFASGNRIFPSCRVASLWFALL